MSKKMTEVVAKEVIIVGGGPAGLKAGEMAEEYGMDYVILEQGSVGQGWKDMRPDLRFLSPCHPQRDWTSLSDRFPIWKLDVDRPYCTAKQFTRYMERFADYFKLNILEQTQANDITHDGDAFIVQTTQGLQYKAPFLVVGTGIFGNPFFPQIPGIKNNPYVMHSHQYMGYEPFKQKKVLVVGAGNSAAEVAIDLCGWSLVYLITRKDLQYFSDTKKLYHIRGISESYLKELISMEIIRYRAHQDIQKIDQNMVYFKDWKMEADKIIFATGYHANIDILRSFKLRVNKNNYPEVSMSGESIQYPNLFFIGPLSYQTSASLVMHGFVKYIPHTMQRISEKLREGQSYFEELDKQKPST
ncbi:MAG: SidA/IucD/PvdA family monooxygenase [Caldithrix sp.]|nr:SidA/IucD/PvdA family monooxygenase [Caldithrix sp.]